jgi:ferrochelatase
MGEDALLLVGHGTVTDAAELPDFLRRIRRGRSASDELLAEVWRRYERVGGSPLLDITHRQAELLRRALGLPVHVAMRMSAPLLEDVLAKIIAQSPRRLCVLPAAPFSVHVYSAATAQILAQLSSRFAAQLPTLIAVDPWGNEPAFLDAHADRIRAKLTTASAPSQLILTAHSLPVEVISAGDPYQLQFEACARGVAERLKEPVRIAYQSQGADGGEWLGPGLKQVLIECRDAGARRVIVAPIGFLTEHVETLYDLDVEARGWCEDLGLQMDRVEALNDSPGLIEAMARAAQRALS